MITAPADDAPSSQKTVIKVNEFFKPYKPEDPSTISMMRLMKENPDIVIEQWGGITLPGGNYLAPLMMSIVGKTSPDVGLAWFHLIRNQVENSFIYPLNEWIGDDLNGDGEIDDKEAKWPGWKKIPPILRKVSTVDGKVYGLPIPDDSIAALVYRIDLVKATGLNPDKPPSTWDELFYWCQKLTDPGKEIPGAYASVGQRGIAIVPAGHLFLPWCQSNGGHPMIQIRKSPKTGKEYVFGQKETKFITPDGENLFAEKSEWRANFASPDCVEAASFYYKLRWAKWLTDPQTGEPVNLTAEDIARGWAERDSSKIEFKPKDVITGVCRMVGDSRASSQMELLGNGEAAMTVGSAKDIALISESTGLDASLLGWFPFPAGPQKNGSRVVLTFNHFAVMYIGVGDRPKTERDKVWKTLLAAHDVRIRENRVKEQILAGMSRFVSPPDLEKFGYEEYLLDVPKNIKNNYAEIESGAVKSYTEPWIGLWYNMDVALQRECLSLILAANGENFDYKSALARIQEKANSGVMLKTPPAVINRARPYARVIFTLVICVLGFVIYRLAKDQVRRNKAYDSRSVYTSWLPVLLLLPAIILITLWSYYPLLRGMVMAFQNYKVVGGSPFVGLENFIILSMDKSFWMSLVRTCYFAFLNMSLAFTAPIILALLLTEAPHGKIFFRTLFFLPQMTSGLVVALLWRMMYDPNPAGFFNQMIGILNLLPFVDIPPQSWLQDPSLAMICCVLPTVWASMGMASLIYLAALHSIPCEFYEAADVDGAGIWTKLTKITLPTLLPLIIINFVGTFIGTFQNMGNIFLLTFGGPGEATTVVVLKIWIEAYNNLRFSMATSMAWILGSLLIGLTYYQIQFLGKLEFKKAKDN